MVTSLAQQEIKDYVQGLATQTLPQSFSVVPGSDGSLTHFEKLEVHCIPNADRKKQALGLFAILLAANHSKGNHSQKQATAIDPGHRVSVSIGPEAFERTRVLSGRGEDAPAGKSPISPRLSPSSPARAGRRGFPSSGRPTSQRSAPVSARATSMLTGPSRSRERATKT